MDTKLSDYKAKLIDLRELYRYSRGDFRGEIVRAIRYCLRKISLLERRAGIGIAEQLRGTNHVSSE